MEEGPLSNGHALAVQRVMPPAIQETFSPTEFFTLGSAARVPFLIGLPDPFRAWFPDEIERELAECQRNLLARGVIAGSEGEPPTIGEPLRSRMGVIGNPDAAFLLLQSDRWRVTRRTIYVRNGRAVELLHSPSSHYEVNERGNLASLRTYLKSLMLPVSGSSATAAAVTFPEHLLRQGERPVRIGDFMAELGRIGVRPEAADAVVRSLVFPDHRSSLVGVRAQDTQWDNAGFVVVERDQELCRVRRFERDGEWWLELVPQTSQDVSRELDQFIDRFVVSRA